jgi:hypothetical protein
MIGANQTAVNLTIQHYGDLEQFMAILENNDWPDYSPGVSDTLAIFDGQGNQEVVKYFMENNIRVANYSPFTDIEQPTGIGYEQIGSTFTIE